MDDSFVLRLCFIVKTRIYDSFTVSHLSSELDVDYTNVHISCVRERHEKHHCTLVGSRLKTGS